MEKTKVIKEKYDSIKAQLNERSRRTWAAAEAISIGHGGIEIISKVTGLSRNTISRGKKEIISGKDYSSDPNAGRIRKKGGGRKCLEDIDAGLVVELDKLIEPETRGDPESPLRWTTKSTRNLADTLTEKGYKTSHTKVSALLKQAGYSLQALRKTNEGKTHPDRNRQFCYINSTVISFQKRGQPVVSVDAKKKELIGNFSNGGQEYQPKGTPEQVNAYDFISLSEGKATPYGVYDISNNKAWVSVGISKDTARFAVSTLRSWWFEMGQALYPDAKELLINADGGGSNGSRNRLWKYELQKFSNETGLEITVCHFSPGTSKWNKIEHRLFAQISKNWRGRPLTTFGTVVSLIGSVTTSSGLAVNAELDSTIYESGIKITNAEFESINIVKHDFHGDDWNYTIKPIE